MSRASPALLLTLFASAASAEGPTEDDLKALDALPWQTSGAGKLGPHAEITIPEGLRFMDGDNASKLIESLGNISSHEELGLVATRDLSWFAVYFFDDVGYVKDDDKDELDANKMAESMKESIAAGNEVRRERKMEEFTFDGWAIPPRYNATTKQLEWASRLGSPSGTSVNYNTRVLGRKGVVRAIVVTDPELLDATLPKFQSMMGGFRFVQGEDYASYRPGDKLAEYGLAALVVGGAGAVAAKTGLLSAAVLFFKKGAKVIVLGLAAAAAFIKNLFARKKEAA